MPFIPRLKSLGFSGILIKEIDIPVKKLDDATMLKIMAQENMEEWDQSPVWAMEVVKTAHHFILETGHQKDVPTAEYMAGFLSWPPQRVKDALANLRSSGEIPIEGKGVEQPIPIKREIFAALPTHKHASEFRRAVQETGASPKVQKAAAKKFAQGSAKKEEAVYEIAREQMKQGEVTTGRTPNKKAPQDPGILLIGRKFDEIARLSKKERFLDMKGYRSPPPGQREHGDLKDGHERDPRDGTGGE